MSNLLVMVPTRKRRNQVQRMVSTFLEATDDAEMLLIVDDDDDSYNGLTWEDPVRSTTIPRMNFVPKINRIALEQAAHYSALMYVGDDHIFCTPDWDKTMLDSLSTMGGTGFVYPDDKRRFDIPEILVISSDIVQALGWFALPAVSHYYIDNAWADIGNATGSLRFVPSVVIQHLHYSLYPGIDHDETYREAEKYGNHDLEAYKQLRSEGMKADIDKVKALLPWHQT
jgi:hypothetical protein